MEYQEAMQVYHTVYDTILSLWQLPIEEIREGRSLWIHVTTTLQSRRNVEQILNELYMLFPEAHVTGIRTEGSIAENEYDIQGTLITITSFRTLEISLYTIENPQNDDYAKWIDLISQKWHESPAGLALFFIDPMHVDSEKIVSLFYQKMPNLLPLAQLASDGYRNYDSFVIAGKKVLQGGASALLIGGDALRFSITHIEDFKFFGPRFQITGAKGQYLYDIEHMHAVSFFREKLGERYIKEYPRSGWCVTLAMEKGRYNLARTPLNLLQDRSILFASSIDKGAYCRFVYIDEEAEYRFQYPYLHEAEQTLYLYLNDVTHRVYRRTKMVRELQILSSRGRLLGACGFGLVTVIDGIVTAFNQTTAIVMIAEETEEKILHIETQTMRIPHREDGNILMEVLDFYLQKELTKIEILSGIGEIWLQKEGGDFIYDRNLQLILESEEAEKIWSIRARLDFTDDLKKWNEWIVDTLQRGLNGYQITTYGTILDAVSGQPITVRLSIVPLRYRNEILGAMAKLERV